MGERKIETEPGHDRAQPSLSDNLEAAQQSAAQKASAELAPHPVRSRRTLFLQVFVLAVIGVFALLAYLVNLKPYTSLDLGITQAFQGESSPLLTIAMRLVSWFGFFPQVIPVILICSLVLLFLGFRRVAAFTALVALVTHSLNLIVKLGVGRPRPAPDLVHVERILNSYSFPSGHVMFYTAYFGFFFFWIYTSLDHSWKRSVLLLLFSSLVILVGPSRIYLGQHWASDVLGAYLLGGLCLYGAILLYRRWIV